MSALRVGIAVLVLASCEGKTESESTPSVDLVARQAAACSEYARVWCGAESTCRPVEFRGAYADEEDCIQREGELCEKTRFGEGSLLEAEELLHCAAASDVSALEGDVSVRCEKWFGWEQGRTPPVECRSKGRLPDGASCLDENQCESGSCRGGDPRAQGCGTCGAMTKLGDECAGDAECEAPYVCIPFEEAPDEIVQRCTQVGGPGFGCAPDAPCRPYLTCVDAKCQPLGGLGAACTTAGTSCAAWLSLACGEDGKCREVSPDHAEGQPCSDLDACKAGLACKVGAALACVPSIADGKVCTLIENYSTGPCLAPALCVGGAFATSARCRIPDAAACNLVLPP